MLKFAICKVFIVISLDKLANPDNLGNQQAIDSTNMWQYYS